MRNAETGEVLAVTHLVGVHFDRESRRSCPLPAGVAEAGQEFVDADG
jgi:acyl-CoA thioester hydrolase